MTASGLDTCSVAYRPQRESYFDALLEKPHVPTGRGGVLFQTAGPGKTKLGAHPANGVVWWEGRADALLTGLEGSWNLRPKGDLAGVDITARRALEQLAGHDLGDGDGELRRFDLASELEFDDGRDGLAFLRTMAGMCPPRRKLDVVKGPDGQPQTVYVRQAKSFVVTERVYDKGVESGSHAPGERIRIEAQRRPPRAKRFRPAHAARMDLSAEFGRTMIPYLGAENVVAAGGKATVTHLAEAAARGEISIAKAERLAGTVEFLREYGRAVYGDDRKARRRLQGLRDAGIALDTELPPDRVLPVGELLRDAVESFSA